MNPHPLCSSLLACALAAAVPAQGSQISPKHYTREEGTSLSSYPFSGTTFPVRYQQVHTDFKGAPHAINTLGFRRDGTRAANALFGARTLDIELRLAHANHPTFGATFSANYATPPITVFTRKLLAVPDLSQPPRLVPPPEQVYFLFDTPFPYDGVQDLLWETVMHGATGPGTAVPLDLATSGMNLVIPAGYLMTGVGCMVPASSNTEMQMRTSSSLQGFPVNAWIFAYDVVSAPASAAAVFLFGTTNPNLTVPGLCTALYVNPVISVSGTTDAAGAWKPLGAMTPAPRIPYSANAVGARTEAQVVALDAQRPVGLPLAASNGVSMAFPDWTPVFQAARLYEVGTTTGTGTLAQGSVIPVRAQW